MFNVMIVQDMQEVCLWIEQLLSQAFANVNTLSCQSYAEAEAHFGEHSISLAIIGFNLPDGDGLSLISCIRGQNPGTRIVVMTSHDDAEHIFPAIHEGAMGYLLKDQPEEVLIEKLRGVMRGEPPLAPSVARKLLEQVRRSPLRQSSETLHINLNKRDEEILVLVAKGLNRTEIAGILCLSPHTVARYIKDLYKKLDVNSRAEAAIMACRLGLVRL